MYSWAGQLYTDLTTVYQGIKRISAGLTGFSGEKIAYRGRKKLLDNGVFFVHEFGGNIYFAHELHELAQMFPNDKMATGSVALIYTNARMGYMTTTGTT